MFVQDYSNAEEVGFSCSNSIVFERFDSYDDSITSSVGSKGDVEHLPSNKMTLLGQQPANNLMLLSLLEHLCALYVGDEDAGGQLFTLLCEKLSYLKLIPNFGSLDDLKALRQKYQAALIGLMTSAIESIQYSGISALDREKIWKIATKNTTSLTLHSWYKDMFCQEVQIAFGGFGEVVKARNKLDQKDYAIKKVKLMESEPDVCFKTLREVQVFSNLHHPNIVRYHSSWLEYGIEEFSRQKMDEVIKNTATINLHSEEDEELKIDIKENSLGNFNFDLLQRKVSEERPQRYISYMNTCDCEDIERLSTNSELENVEVGRPRRISRSLSSGDLPFNRDNMEEVNYCRGKLYYVNGHKKMQRALNMTLFIQMELCHLTLQEWIKNRNSKIDHIGSSDRLMNLRIFQQIISALRYVHHQGLIHRDIKPANIFLNYLEGSSMVVKVGDFGLTRNDSQKKRTSDDDDVFVSTNTALSFQSINFDELNLTAGVGTAIYAAPEQKSANCYSNKVDIFSLGIILFELFEVFKTQMERMKSIEQLLNNSTCGRVDILWPDVSKVILQMTSNEPDIRPSAENVFNSSLVAGLDDNIDELKKEIQRKDMEIEKLKNLLSEVQSKICHQCQSLCSHRK